MFKSPILAGYECGFLEWQGHDLLESTRHTPGEAMADNYRLAHRLGMLTARDGLPPTHDPVERLTVARDAGMQVIWDLTHYWRHPDPIGYAQRIAEAVRLVTPGEPFWCCPVNEPTIHATMVPGESVAFVVGQALQMLGVLKGELEDVRAISTDPFNYFGENLEGLELMSTHVDIIGLNVYAHHKREDGLAELLEHVHLLTGKPVMIAETGCDPRVSEGWRKTQWLAYVLEQVEKAKGNGVPVAGVCLYPFIETPVWHAPRSGEFADGGIVSPGGTIAPALADFIRQATRP